ncbi:MAG TPA: NADH-quinone oxidoreductase subunit C [Terracidiphilus sp.]|nr:NADH-quinone oxidoreductase subunit C [Terracidiphilus sp.]
MSAVETIPAQSTIEGVWTESSGVLWYGGEHLSLREVAAAMNAVGARFVTITAHQLSGPQALRLEYHWDMEGRLLGFAFPLEGKAMDSIFDICEAADWIEREVHEQFAVDFIGREYEPLLLRAGNKAGIYLREEVER